MFLLSPTTFCCDAWRASTVWRQFITRAIHETCFCCRSCNGRFFLSLLAVHELHGRRLHVFHKSRPYYWLLSRSQSGKNMSSCILQAYIIIELKIQNNITIFLDVGPPQDNWYATLSTWVTGLTLELQHSNLHQCTRTCN